MRLLEILFYITLFGSVLYIVQGITGVKTLSGLVQKLHSGPLKIRGYNIPRLHFFFVFYALFANPFKRSLRYISIGVYAFVPIISMHRNLILTLILLSFVGLYYVQGGARGVVKYLFIGVMALIPLSDVVMSRFEGDDFSNDINSVIEGAFLDYMSEDADQKSTFLFRIALLYERVEYMAKDPMNLFWGVGFMHEDSALSEQKFDFVIGVYDRNNYKVIQLDSSDISWVPFLLRLGIAGTVIYLSIYLVMTLAFFRKKEDIYMLVALLYILYIVTTSIASSMLYESQTIIPAILCYIILQKKNEKGELYNE
ncbi:hypothetical protein [Dysgonomonas sp. 216]|uniref:hypothetical protein n=1 Tax=Dysgonomonas sp. 216 TaxID=2302934 RepID=UPI001C87FE37|nr:hypothetical protein [Dysgonomonas sp. 216]